MDARGEEEGAGGLRDGESAVYTSETGHTEHGMRKRKESRPKARFPGLSSWVNQWPLWAQPWAAGQGDCMTLCGLQSRPHGEAVTHLVLGLFNQ